MEVSAKSVAVIILKYVRMSNQHVVTHYTYTMLLCQVHLNKADGWEGWPSQCQDHRGNVFHKQPTYYNSISEALTVPGTVLSFYLFYLTWQVVLVFFHDRKRSLSTERLRNPLLQVPE